MESFLPLRTILSPPMRPGSSPEYLIELLATRLPGSAVSTAVEPGEVRRKALFLRTHSQISSADIAVERIARIKMSEIRHEIMRGRVMLCISLATDELASFESPEPLYALVSRLIYLPSLYLDICSHFGDYVVHQATCQPLWFSRQDDEVAIPLHYPIGKSEFIV